MSYTAIATDKFDAVLHFYESGLGFRRESLWDRPNGRGVRLALYGLRLEILDNLRLKTPFELGSAGGRFHLVLETEDLEAARAAISLEASPIRATSWGASLFELTDPDGIHVTFLQWR